MIPGNRSVKATLSANKSVPHLDARANVTSAQVNITQRKRRNTENLESAKHPRNQSQSLSFREFRVLLAKTNSGPIDWEFEWKEETRDITVLETEYHIIRQILIILNRQLDDMASAFRSLRRFSPSHILNFLVKFKELRAQADLFNTHLQIETGTEPSDQDTKLVISRANNKPLMLQQDSAPINGFRSSDENIKLDLPGGSSRKIPKRERLADKEMISYFLEKSSVQFLPEDVFYIFKAFGSESDHLSMEHIELAMHCPIWSAYN